MNCKQIIKTLVYLHLRDIIKGKCSWFAMKYELYPCTHCVEIEKKSRTFKIKSHLPSQTIEDPTCLYHSYNIAFPDQPTTECDFNGTVVPVFNPNVYQNITNS